MSKSKITLVHHDRAKDRPPLGTPEHLAWVEERARKEFEEIFSDENQAKLQKIYDEDPEAFKGMLCGSPEYMELPEEEQEALDIASEERFLKERRDKFKVVK